MRVTKTLTMKEMQDHLNRSSVLSIQNGRTEGEVTAAVGITHLIDGYKVFENYSYCVAKKIYVLRQFGVSATKEAKGDIVSFMWSRGTDSAKMLDVYNQLFPTAELMSV